MPNRPSLDDYVDVAERIAAFKQEHPEGSLQTIRWEVVEVGGKPFVVYRAAAYRSQDDTRPGHGTAWEPFPGKTPYTKDSELMNAETAAWGRAIVALGIAASKKIASRQEVKARLEEPEEAADGATEASTQAASKETRKALADAYREARSAGMSTADFRAIVREHLSIEDNASVREIAQKLTEDEALQLTLVLQRRGEEKWNQAKHGRCGS